MGGLWWVVVVAWCALSLVFVWVGRMIRWWSWCGGVVGSGAVCGWVVAAVVASGGVGGFLPLLGVVVEGL